MAREFLGALDEACVGQVSEIFDGNAPHTPRGLLQKRGSVIFVGVVGAAWLTPT